MVKNIVFDIGNVLAGFVWEDFFRSFGFEESVFQRLAKATVKDAFWNEFDKGEYETEGIINGFINKDPEIETEIRKVFTDVDGMILRYEYAKPWILSLKKRGYAIYVISNFAQKAYEDCKGALDFLEEVDGVILSYREKIIKPCPEIYQLLCKRYQLKPEECVFIDDLTRNVEAAKQEGMQGIVFEDLEQAKQALEECLSLE